MTNGSNVYVIVKEWPFSASGKLIWKAADASCQIVDTPTGCRIDSLVATAPLLSGTSDSPCFMRLVRHGDGSILLQCEPEDCRWALGLYDATGEHFVDGDTAMWDLTFRFNDQGEL